MNLLVVDDSPANRKLLRITLEDEGHSVFEARDGVEALSVLEGAPVDAVISDILMPNMDGYRLCHEVRRNEKIRHIAFIHYTSTYTSPGDQKLSHSVDADDYLTKPVSTQTLLGAIRKAITLSANRKESTVRKSDTKFVMKQYNETLVKKLEERNAELVRTEADLLRTHQQLVRHAEAVEKLNGDLEERVRERTAELERANRELQQALADVKELSGLLPICAYCKKIRDGEDYWHSLEKYVVTHTKAQLSHGVCPDCYEKVMKPQLEEYMARLGSGSASGRGKEPGS